MKVATLLSILFFSLSIKAYEVSYNVFKDREQVGVLNFAKNPLDIEVAESVLVQGYIDNNNINFTYVRMQNKQYTACSKPKDRPAVCKSVHDAIFILPHPPLNEIGLPSIPSFLNFSLPDLEHGSAGGYTLSIR
jgi:hypothetical protein